MDELNPQINPHIEAELRRQFRPVAAPEGLWNRIAAPPVAVKRVRSSLMPMSFIPVSFIPLAATVCLALLAGVLWQASVRPGRGGFSGTDLRSIASASVGPALTSDDPVRIRQWVKAKSGIDIALPLRCAGSVHLLGAKLVRVRGTLVAAVAYQNEGQPATLLVSKKLSAQNAALPEPGKYFARLFPAGFFSRDQPRDDPGEETGQLSWIMREQTYTIAFAGAAEPAGGCAACHGDSHAYTHTRL